MVLIIPLKTRHKLYINQMVLGILILIIKLYLEGESRE